MGTIEESEDTGTVMNPEDEAERGIGATPVGVKTKFEHEIVQQAGGAITLDDFCLRASPGIG